MTEWRKSSWSGGVNDNACVELAKLGDRVGVRDSRNRLGARLELTVPEFGVLLTRIRRGELDL
ncbi:DUF397 domain-containing protein [Actinomadura luteofluorescens]|uniref:DUF397 domain-containing protein n=1 Tax=Actinomadura luteofluorescens TaxID=46163 RepID=A0A7Y9JJ00_9ACTN|nr:DUF397 domain-containing protein [Actinomadura luteofluorescens]NYD50947.1 hypothetical protein [Actinomadura luteofluorescens]